MSTQELFLLSLVILFGALAAGLAVYIWRHRLQHSLIDNLSDGVLALDGRDRVVRFNPAAQDILGYPADAILGKSMASLVPEAAELLASPTSDDQQMTILLGPGGVEKVYDLRLADWRGRDGRRLGRLAILRDITSTKSLERSLLAQKQMFENLVAVARATSERPTVEDTLQNSLDVAASLTGAEFGSLFIVDRAGHVTHSIIALGMKKTTQEKELARRVLDRGLAGWVARHRQSALIDETTEDERWLPSADKNHEARSALSVPILAHGNLLGVLTLTHSKANWFRSEQVYLMQAAADQMALAVRNAQLFDEQRQLASRQATLYGVFSTVGRHLEPQAVVKTAVESVARLTSWPAVTVLLPEEGGPDLLVRGSAGLLAMEEGERVDREQGLVGRAIKAGQLQYTDRIDSGEEPARSNGSQIASELVVPLRRSERMLGVLQIQSDRPFAFNEDEQQLATSLADAIALVLDNARYHAAMRKHAADMNVLYAINRMIGRSLVLEEMLSKVLYSALTSLGFGFGFIALTHEKSGNLRLATERNLPDEMVSQYRQDSIDDSFGAYVHGQNEAVVIDDLNELSPPVLHLETSAPRLLESLRSLEIRACAGIPLWHQRQSLGIMCMFSRNPRQFSAEDRALQVTIGQQIALAVTNVRLFRSISDERRLLQALIGSSRDGIIMVGPSQEILVINQPALDLLGFDAATRSWVNRSWPELVAELESRLTAEIPADLRRLKIGLGEAGEGEFGLPPKELHWLSLPVNTEHEVLGYFLVLRDITEARKIEKLRDDLIHTMVHDLRNPLTSIFGAIEFLEAEIGLNLQKEQQQVLEIAMVNSYQMVRMVNSILDLHRLESGQMPLNQKPVAFSSLVENVLRGQQGQAELKKIALVNNVPSGLPLIWADMNLTERVLQNLIGNALKFCPEGSHVEIKATADGDHQVLVSVIDDGPGIASETAERLFQKFSTGRIESSGSGLGLAFCKMVVNSHGGDIWLESEPGSGAAFFFTMPLLPAA